MEVKILFVEYEDSKVKDLFDDLNNVQGSKRLMIREIGNELTRAVKKKYIQIVSFSTFAMLQRSGIGHIESLEGDLHGRYSLTVSANYRLIIRPKVQDLSAESLQKCDTVIIEGVIDYHGKGKKHSWIIP